MKDGLKNTVDIFINIFQEQWNTELNCIFQNKFELFLRLVRSDNFKLIFLFLDLDPVVSLDLGIDHEWPSA